MTTSATPSEATTSNGLYHNETVQVVDQALVVLKDVCGSSEPRGVRELSRDLGYSKSTVQRILSSLFVAGLVSVDEASRKYTVGPAALTLAWQYTTSSNLVSAAAGIAEALAVKTGETVSVSTLTDNKRVTVYEAESPHQLRLSTGVGRPHSLLAGATSRVLLSLLTPEERKLAIERAISEGVAEGRHQVEPAELEERVQVAAVERMAISHGEWIDGAVGLSVPIGRHGDDLAALSIYGPAIRISEETVSEFITALSEAAKTIQMAWRG
ncbi:DNA-binding IclR family transcriptional regulator [Arthrobacter pigmenti]|uniref:DNA-binding IclR family transcriptional regulator n=1 Tax=Arthrobacter pigmenti TaxID=271432 RepID=A0A846RVL4_9MICC|nr:IclR family transcriptional regulator [Arthrobacter pigmenti]NJC23645.1 DNA-binding IclR family transcriptional regulator [Arthrobacter pigmenti]